MDLWLKCTHSYDWNRVIAQEVANRDFLPAKESRDQTWLSHLYRCVTRIETSTNLNGFCNTHHERQVYDIWKTGTHDDLKEVLFFYSINC
jgi:hypothetical protein